ncbi:transcriptional regulator, LysR family [Colwellia chukchiensis]|uniref:Transcriptional regulator, LysR family n=1 Tax=Colwellia chukchiensis TaxID=641665 RepID=A0A1H7QF99_9GAMM|nr:LysR substrate-binding domain-containing protein [Colwellia chukchiensis]SEL46324.1 transcriptional regulator, LysR family [Colwellia chukchiensis]
MSKKAGFGRLPPLSALRGFEAAARLNSFSKAASELCMTQSAISHQVKLLEDYFGQPLFKRINRKVEVTDAGIDFLKTTQLTLGQLQKGTIRLEFFNKPGLVVLYTSPPFANKWLNPRIPAFKKQHPNIDAWIYTEYSQEPLEHAEVDLAIWLGTGDWPGVTCIKLFSDEVTPLYAPSMLQAGDNIVSASDLTRYPLIHDNQMSRREDWYAWSLAMGVDGFESAGGYNFNDSSLALDCALAGQGVVLGSVLLAQDLIKSGQLIRPFSGGLMTELNYYLVFRPDKLDNPDIRNTAHWLLNEFSIAPP